MLIQLFAVQVQPVPADIEFSDKPAGSISVTVSAPIVGQ